MKINWKEKLSSRKFWALVAALVSSILVFFNASDNTATQVGSIITAFGSVCVYTLAEASVDKKRLEENSETYYEEDL